MTIPLPYNTRIIARRDDFVGDYVAIYVFQESEDGKRYALDEPVFRGPIEPGTMQTATIYLRPEIAQRFMDQLWDCGLRPTEGKGSAGALAATEAHLKDMRQIATQLLNDKLHGA